MNTAPSDAPKTSLLGTARTIVPVIVVPAALAAMLIIAYMTELGRLSHPMLKAFKISFELLQIPSMFDT